MEPVVIEVRRECRYKAKPCKTCGKPKTNAVHHKTRGSCDFKRQLGCATCGLAKSHIHHAGAPESYNVFASGDWKAYQSAKKRQQDVLRPVLAASGLEACERIIVEAECSFGDGAHRDQGNYRVVPEKALGDLLVEMAYLPADTWDRYEFGNLALREDGESWLRLTLFPMPLAPTRTAPEAQGSLL